MKRKYWTVKNIWVNLGQEKLILSKQPTQVQDEKNTSLFRQQLVKRGKIGQENIEESKTLNKFPWNQGQTLNSRKSLLTCCAASRVCKQSCPRPLKNMKNQEALSPKFSQKLKNRRYSYCVISRYFALGHLGRLLTPFIAKFHFRATALLQQRPEVTSEFRLGVVGRVNELQRTDFCPLDSQGVLH